MSIHTAGFIDRQLATTVAYLLDTSLDCAERLIDNLRAVGSADAGTVGVVAELIITSITHKLPPDDVVLPEQQSQAAVLAGTDHFVT